MLNMARLSKVFLSFLSAVVLFSCHQPKYVDTFMRVDERRSDGAYVFDLDFSDTTRTYDLHLYTRADAHPRDIRLIDRITLRVQLVSPSGKGFAESVLLPLSHRYSIFSKECIQPYRTGCVPSEWGHWQLCITPADDKAMLNGIGLKITYGKR